MGMRRRAHPFTQGIFARVTKWRIAQIMGQTRHLHHAAYVLGAVIGRQKTIAFEHRPDAIADAATHTRHFHAVGKAVVG